MLVAQPQMIVVRADDHVFRAGPRQIGRDVVHGLRFVRNIDLQIDGQFSECERPRLQIAIDIGFDLAQVPSFGAKPLFSRPRPSPARRKCPRREGRPWNRIPRVCLPCRVRRHVVDQDHAARAVRFRVGHFIDEGRVGGKLLAIENAVLVVLLRFMSQDQNQLSPDVKIRVIVVTYMRAP